MLQGVALAAPAPDGAPGFEALQQSYQRLMPRLQQNPYGRPLVIASSESGERVEGEVFAVLDFPQAQVRASLQTPAAWCALMMLPMNTKHCAVTPQGGLTLYLGTKTPQALEQATPIAFGLQSHVGAADALQVSMGAPEGPMGTRAYRIVLQSAALSPGKSFMHLRYSYQVGARARLALAAYLATLGRGKVGFSRDDDGAALVGGMRGIVERTAMRYYLALDAYLRSLALAPEAQLENRLQTWFTLSEAYPRQLHEMERADYLAMKRAELRR